MAVTESETKPVTIALADLEVGMPVPDTATCELEIVSTGPESMVVEIELNGLTYIVEDNGLSGELTAVYGDEDVGRPGSVPLWLSSAVELVGIDEVTL